MAMDDLIADLQKRVADLERLTRNIPLRWPTGGGGGGDFTIEDRTQLPFPEIPTEPTLIWCGGQIWAAGPGWPAWEPAGRLTIQTGEPGTS